MKPIIWAIAATLMSFGNLSGQESFVLQHQFKDKKVHFNLKHHYTIITEDTTFFTQIIGFTDEALLIPHWKQTGQDTSVTYTYHRRKKADTTYTMTFPLYEQDTLPILFSDIEMIKKDWFQKRDWLVVFGQMALAGTVAIAITPVVGAVSGAGAMLEMMRSAGICLAISAPPLIIGTRAKKYDLRKKWSIKRE